MVTKSGTSISVRLKLVPCSIILKIETIFTRKILKSSLIRVDWISKMILTSESAPWSTPGHTNVTNSWHLLCTTKLHTEIQRNIEVNEVNLTGPYFSPFLRGGGYYSEKCIDPCQDWNLCARLQKSLWNPKALERKLGKLSELLLRSHLKPHKRVYKTALKYNWGFWKIQKL